MAYIKTLWKTRIGTLLNRFLKSYETADSVVLVNDPGSITEQGTPFDVENMNKIEQGIFDAHEGIAAEEQERVQADTEVLEEAKAYTNTEIAATVAASQTWLPAVDTADDLPAVTDTTKTYLCKTKREQIIYQCVAEQTEWAQYDDRTDLVNEDELDEGISEHNENENAHQDIRAGIESEAEAREEADTALSERINMLAPEGLSSLPDLFAQKAPANITLADGAESNALPATDTEIPLVNVVQAFRSNLKHLFNSKQPKIIEAVCDTAVGGQAKAVAISGYALSKGDILAITYANGSTASSATININNAGAKAVKIGGKNPGGAQGTGAHHVSAGGTILYFYDGAYMCMFGSTDDIDNDTQIITVSNMNLTERESSLSKGALYFYQQPAVQGIENNQLYIGGLDNKARKVAPPAAPSLPAFPDVGSFYGNGEFETLVVLFPNANKVITVGLQGVLRKAKDNLNRFPDEIWMLDPGISTPQGIMYTAAAPGTWKVTAIVNTNTTFLCVGIRGCTIQRIM